jgi:hypothetical protein
MATQRNLTDPATSKVPSGIPPYRNFPQRDHSVAEFNDEQPDWLPLLQAVASESDADRKAEEMDRAVEAISDSELVNALSSLLLQTNSDVAELSELLARRWAELDPVAAGEWASAIAEDNSIGRSLIEQVAVAWAEKDLSGAIDWIQTLAPAENKTAASIAVSYEVARTDPLAALELAGTLPSGSRRDDLLVHAVSQWAGSDADTAMMWAAKVPDQALRERLISAIAVASAEQNPSAAATLLVQNIDPGAILDRAAVAIVQRWAQQSPQDAADWVTRFPDSAARQTAINDLFSIWNLSNVESARGRAAALP